VLGRAGPDAPRRQPRLQAWTARCSPWECAGWLWLAYAVLGVLMLIPVEGRLHRMEEEMRKRCGLGALPAVAPACLPTALRGGFTVTLQNQSSTLRVQGYAPPRPAGRNCEITRCAENVPCQSGSEIVDYTEERGGGAKEGKK